MKPTEQELQEIGKAALDAYYRHSGTDMNLECREFVGRAAFLAAAKLCLRELSAEECEYVHERRLGFALDSEWAKAMNYTLANRLASLTEPDPNEGIKDLLSPTCQNMWKPSKQEYDRAVIEAYRRGKESK